MTSRPSPLMPLVSLLVVSSIPACGQDCSPLGDPTVPAARTDVQPADPRLTPLAVEQPPVEGNGFRAVTDNFLVISQNARHPADQIAVECERQRSRIQQQWLGRTGADWTQKCEVFIHSDESAYLAHVGWQAAMTRGKCRIDRQRNRIVSRRIDLMADPQSQKLSALAHELTHLVLADRFPVRQPPRWADEGIALLADDPQKQSLHLRDLHRALTDRCCPDVREVLAMHRYPQGPRLMAFYGQSLSLIDYLSHLAEPSKVVDMIAIAMENGYDAALQEVYGIDSTTELERRWRRHLSGQPQLVAHAQ